jgi:CheY-like chemotaxis protein
LSKAKVANVRRAILIVDDEDETREVTASLLSGAGYYTIEASNGRHALDRLAEIAKPAAILLDMLMPVMGGDELVEELSRRNELQGLNVLIVSASDDIRDAHEVAKHLPMLCKPFDGARLLDFIESHCRPLRGTRSSKP